MFSSECESVTCQATYLLHKTGWVGSPDWTLRVNACTWCTGSDPATVRVGCLQSESNFIYMVTHKGWKLRLQRQLYTIYAVCFLILLIPMATVNLFLSLPNHHIIHYSFSRSKYFHLLRAPIKGFITLIG